LALVLCGCSATPKRVVHTTLGVVTDSVLVGLSCYNEYLKECRMRAEDWTLPSNKREEWAKAHAEAKAVLPELRDAHAKFQAAALATAAVAELPYDMVPATTEVQAAAMAVLELVRRFQ